MTYRLLSMSLVGALLLTSGAARAQDEVTYFDRATKKEDRVSGTIQQENPGKVTIKPVTGATRDVAAQDVRDVLYNLSAVEKNEYRGAAAREAAAEKEAKPDQRKKDLGEALTRYQALVPKVKGEAVKRHVQFKVAKILARQADDDPAKADAAASALKKFKTDHPNAWQIGACTDLLARLLIAKKDYEGAQKAYQELEATPNLAPAARQEANLKAAGVMVKAGKYAEAEKRLRELAKDIPAASPEGVRLQLTLAECEAASGKADEGVKRLTAVLDQITDPDMKAAAYNALGDCHRAAQRPKDALWAYLWVDVIYNQNRQEHARALYHLVGLFQELKDEKRTKEYRAKLEGGQFMGLDYQKRLASEK